MENQESNSIVLSQSPITKDEQNYIMVDVDKEIEKKKNV